MRENLQKGDGIDVSMTYLSMTSSFFSDFLEATPTPLPLCPHISYTYNTMS